MRCRHPVQGRLHAAAIRRVTAARRRVVYASKLDDLTAVVLDHLGARDEIGTTQPHFSTLREPEEFFRRILEEIVTLDQELARKRHATRAR